jgi:hypothetical protein
MYHHLINHLTLDQVNELFTEITPFLKNDHKLLGLSEDQAGTEYDLTSKNAIPHYVNLVEQICSQLTAKKLKCQNYWISVSKPGTTVVSHNHQDQINCDFSAIIYVVANKDSGQLCLENYQVSLTVESGDLVLFPAWCYHSVSANCSTHDRICIAFDLKQQ